MSEKLDKISSADKSVSLDDRTPFREVLKETVLTETELHGYLRQIESRPNKVIRVLPERRSRGQFLDSITKENKNEVIAKYSRGKELFDQLRAEYHIPVPDIDIVFGETRKGKITAFVIVDRIEGKGLDGLMNRPDKASVPEATFWPQLDELYTNLTHYFVDRYERGGEFLEDITSSRQWMWGHRVGETKDRPWIVDVDPIFSKYDPTLPDSVEAEALFEQIDRIADTIDTIRMKDGAGCEQTRAALRRFIESVPQNDLNRFRIKNYF